MKLKLALVLVAILQAATVAAQDPPAQSPSAAGASVDFANLENGQTVPPGYVVKFTISGMGIAPAGTNIENTGHFHLLIDLDELPDLKQPLPATEHIIHFGKGQTETELDLPDGPHTLQLMLADYAHVPHDPPVMSDVITVTVSVDAPTPVDAEDH